MGLPLAHGYQYTVRSLLNEERFLDMAVEQLSAETIYCSRYWCKLNHLPMAKNALGKARLADVAQWFLVVSENIP